MPQKCTNFSPDYTNLQKAARNQTAPRLPLYEHGVSDKVMEQVLGREFSHLLQGGSRDKEEYFTSYCEFYRKMGYDTVSFECCVGPAMPGSGLLGGHGDSVIQSWEDFEKYPWKEIPKRYFSMNSEKFDALARVIPDGMKAVGGVGNGVFECVQDIIGYMNLCYISSDEPELYEALFQKTGEIVLEIWEEFLKRYGDLFCVLRFGDDLGFKSNTLLAADDIRRLIIPQYAKIIRCVHSHGKPFLLHSCGNIFDVMPDLINTAGIDAKHSNEDQIAPFGVWVEKYGDNIGNFGGMDVDVLCQATTDEIRGHVHRILDQCKNRGGIAFGTGNSIPEYVPVENYVQMTEAVRQYRGE